MDMLEVMRQILNGQKEMQEDLKGLKGELNELKKGQEKTNLRLDKIENRLDQIDTRLDRIEVQQAGEVQTLVKEIVRLKKIYSPEVLEAVKKSI